MILLFLLLNDCVLGSLDDIRKLPYSNGAMRVGQHANNGKLSDRPNLRRRLIAAVVFATIAGGFGFLWLAQIYHLDVGRWFGRCGFKQKYGLLCPTCGMTTAVLSFARGDIRGAFYAQPAGGLLCCAAVAAAILALSVAALGIGVSVVKSLRNVKSWQILAVLAAVILAGWAVTLARVLTDQ